MALDENKVVQILNTIPDHIPDEWPTCPHYTLRPQQQNRALSWMLAILVTSRTQSQRELTLQEYIEYLKKVTMETLHEGQPEERSGKGITNAGLLPLNKTHYVASHWIKKSSLQAKKFCNYVMRNSIVKS